MNNTGPFAQPTPELLAQWASGAFRPPGLAAAPMPTPAAAAPQFGIGPGLAMLSAGLLARSRRQRPPPDILTGCIGGFPPDLWEELFGRGG